MKNRSNIPMVTCKNTVVISGKEKQHRKELFWGMADNSVFLVPQKICFHGLHPGKTQTRGYKCSQTFWCCTYKGRG